jgi:lipid-A-disaccharide synthase-like uncharacterized protein
MSAGKTRSDDAAPGARGKRLKWEPAALMVLVLGLGLWIAFGPGSKPKFPITPDALTQDVRIGNTRGLLEAFTPQGAAEPTLRLWITDGPNPPPLMSAAQARASLGSRVVDETLGQRRNWVFKTFNITSWTSVVWVGIGLIGQLAFSGRMVLQWIVSEKKRQSVISESFWWFSLFGGVTLFSYFVWRQDPVALLGQASGIVIYARNLRLIYKHKARQSRLSSETPGEPSDLSAQETANHSDSPRSVQTRGVSQKVGA